MKIKKTVIPVAGLGTRFLPATKTVPKELLPIVDIPAIQYVVQEAVDSGITEVIFVTGRGKDSIEDHFDIAPELEQVLEERGKTEMVETLRQISAIIDIVSVRQKRPLGLGHAVGCARELVGNEPFAVLLPDDIIDASVPCIRQLLDVFEEKKESVVALMRVGSEEVGRYGIMRGERLRERLYLVEEALEKPAPQNAPSDLAITGRYVLKPEIFSVLEKLAPGAGGEIQLTDGISRLARQGKVYGCEFVGQRYDVGDKFGFIQANIAFALKRPELRDHVKEYLRTLISEKGE